MTSTQDSPSEEAAEWGEEVIYACRSGDAEYLRELLDEPPPPSSSIATSARPQTLKHAVRTYAVDPKNKTTALHMACANGHAEIARMMLEAGAAQVTNASGNAPLHWAVLNKQAAVVEVLLSFKHEDEQDAKLVDVLQVNANGKSVSSLAFESADQTILKLVLEHPSAAPLEAKKPGEEEGDEEEGERTTEKQSITMRFGNLAVGERAETALMIRQVGIRPRTLEELADTQSLTGTGATIWAASVILARFCLDPEIEETLLKEASVMELGAGCGLPGLAVWWCVRAGHLPRRVMLTDGEDLDNLEHNARVAMQRAKKKAKRETSLEVRTLDWRLQHTWPEEWIGSTDVLLGADLVYDPAVVSSLVSTASALLRPGGTFLYCTASTARAGMEEFLQLMAARFTVEKRPVKPEYLRNPLPDKSDEEAFDLFFHELVSVPHDLYKFTMR